MKEISQEEIYNNTTINIKYIKRNWLSKKLYGDVQIILRWLDKVNEDYVQKYGIYIHNTKEEKKINIKCHNSYELEKQILRYYNKFIRDIWYRYRIPRKYKIINKIENLNHIHKNEKYCDFRKRKENFHIVN